MMKKDIKKSGLAIPSFVLGIFAFIPMIGVIIGLIAIILGMISYRQIKENGLRGIGFAKIGIILGILGIAFTFLFYSLVINKLKINQNILSQDSSNLKLYRKKYGVYPKSFEVMINAGYKIITNDADLKPFHYMVSKDGQSYTMKNSL